MRDFRKMIWRELFYRIYLIGDTREGFGAPRLIDRIDQLAEIV
jgi:hypothetical protein